MSFMNHMDLFSLSVGIGKLIKMAFQFYVEGYLLQELDEIVIYYPEEDESMKEELPLPRLPGSDHH